MSTYGTAARQHAVALPAVILGGRQYQFTVQEILDTKLIWRFYGIPKESPRDMTPHPRRCCLHTLPASVLL